MVEEAALTDGGVEEAAPTDGVVEEAAPTDGVVEEAALTDGGVEEAEKVYGDKARIAPPEPSLDTSSVLSESDTLALDDPIVAVSRSMSVQAPMDTYAEALANGVSCEVHGLVM